MQKNFLVYGAGSIGVVLTYSLLNADQTVYLLCKKKYLNFYKKNGILLEIYNNEKFKKKINLINYKKLNLITNISEVKLKLSAVFITTKITTNLEKILKSVNKVISKKTLLVPPCTSIPFWWHLIIKNKFKERHFRNISKYYKYNLKLKNLVAMSMWLSSTKIKRGVFRLNHVQRGFPIKEVFYKKKNDVDKLRFLIKKSIKSPIINNPYYEIFTKSINSLAFNMVAILYNQNNMQLNKNLVARKKILLILKEGDEILKKLNIRVHQSSYSRLKQTLSSTAHTMSMLKDFRVGKKLEIPYMWKSLKFILKLTELNMKNTELLYKDYLNLIKNIKN